jgi:hypothetical protein
MLTNWIYQCCKAKKKLLFCECSNLMVCSGYSPHMKPVVLKLLLFISLFSTLMSLQSEKCRCILHTTTNISIQLMDASDFRSNQTWSIERKYFSAVTKYRSFQEIFCYCPRCALCKYNKNYKHCAMVLGSI